MDFEVQYENNSTSNYLVLRPKTDREIINYQTQMLLNNKIDGILDFNINYIKDNWNCYYDITSKYTLESFLLRKHFSRDEFLLTLRMIINNIINLKNYLLYDSNILLDENYIYIEPESMIIYFVYIPFQNCENNLKDFFTKLIVKLIKFQNENSDNYIQKILEVIKSDLFNLKSLKHLIESLLGDEIKTHGATIKESLKFDIPNVKVDKPVLEKKSAARGNVKIPGVHDEKKQTKQVLKTLYLNFKSKIAHDIKKNNCDEYSQEPITELAHVNYHGETEIIIKPKAEGTPQLKEKDGEEVIKIDKESVLIGRMESFVDYVINSTAIGKIHAEIMNEKGTFYVMDCNSRNGTYINGVRVVPNTKVRVNKNDELRFANKEFILVY